MKEQKEAQKVLKGLEHNVDRLRQHNNRMVAELAGSSNASKHAG